MGCHRDLHHSGHRRRSRTRYFRSSGTVNVIMTWKFGKLIFEKLVMEILCTHQVCFLKYEGLTMG